MGRANLKKKKPLYFVLRQKEKYKILIMAVLLGICCFLTYYFHIVLKTYIVFTHFFYIPIILACIWWRKKGLLAALLLAAFLVLSDVFFDAGLIVSDGCRAVMFIIIGFVTAMLSEKIMRAEILLENKKQILQIVEGSPTPIFVIDKKHIVRYWNKACGSLTGISADKMIGTKKQWMAFYPKERYVMADFIVDKSPEEKIDHYYTGKYKKSALIDGAYDAENFFPNLGKKGKWLFFTAAPLKDSKGNIIGAIETLQDITKRKKAEEEIKKNYEKLKKTDELKSILLRDVSHELKTPTSLITLVSNLLKSEFKKEKTDNQKINSYIDILLRNSKLFENEINSILELSRLEATQSIETRKMNITEVVSSVAEKNKILAKEKGIIMRKKIEKAITIYANQSLITSLLRNLVSNAIKFTNKGHVEIACSKLNNNVLISVKDTGIGISKKDMNKLFQPFVKLDPSTKGVGVGLAICRNIAELHNGTIDVKSAPGKGTKFRVTIPIKKR